MERHAHQPGVWLLAIVLSACAGSRGAYAAATLPIHVTLQGLDADLEHNVRAHLSIANRRGKVSEAEARELDEKARSEIGLALQPFGFYRSAVWSELEARGGAWEVLYRVDPGPVMHVDTLEVRIVGEGADDPAFQKVLANLPLHQGDPLHHVAYEAAKQAITTAALQNGYIDGRFETHELRVDVAGNASAIVLHYWTGPRYVFGAVEFHQEAVDTDLVQGYVTFHRGDAVNYGKLLDLEQSLGNSPYWSRVEVRPRRDLAQSDELPIAVDLTPSKPEKYTAGVGYGTDNGAHARSTIELRRLNRRGHRALLEGTVSSIEQSATVRYEVPWPYPRTDVLTYSTGYSRIKTLTSDGRTALVGVNLARLWAGWQEGFALQYRREKFTVGLDQGYNGFLVPGASWNRVHADDPLDPHNARRLRFGVSAADRSLLSAASYVQLESSAMWIRTFSSRHQLTGRLDAGATWTDGFHSLPPSVRFFAGGANSVRGYEYNTLGPRDAAGNVSGGTRLAVASVEYELRFQKAWGVATFVDAGNAMVSFSGPYREGVGFGLRWLSPIGLVRGDLAWPVNDPRHKVQFHLSIGPGL